MCLPYFSVCVNQRLSGIPKPNTDTTPALTLNSLKRHKTTDNSTPSDLFKAFEFEWGRTLGVSEHNNP